MMYDNDDKKYVLEVYLNDNDHTMKMSEILKDNSYCEINTDGFRLVDSFPKSVNLEYGNIIRKKFKNIVSKRDYDIELDKFNKK